MKLIDADKYRDSLEESWKNCQKWQNGADTEEIRIRAEQAEITFMECILRLKEQPTVEAVPIEWINHYMDTELTKGSLFYSCMREFMRDWKAEQEKQNDQLGH